MFGKGAWKNNKYGKIMGTSLGLATVIMGKAYKHLYEFKNKEKWIPETRRKERQLNEYIDMLKYVKYTKLYEKYAKLAEEKDNFNIKAFIYGHKKKGRIRKERLNQLTQLKKQNKTLSDNNKTLKKSIRNVKLKYINKNTDTIFKKIKRFLFGYDKDNVNKAINKEINEIKQYRISYKVPKNALKALTYYKKRKQTMYAYDSGDPLADSLIGMPKKDRKYMKYFMKAPEEEKLKILEEAPRYLRRPLESAWNLPVEKKVNLKKYFTKHGLPSSKWKGWNENVNLDNVKVKMINHEGLDYSEFNVWRDDVEKANQSGPIPLPKVNFRQNSQTIRTKLMQILKEQGYKDIQVDMSPRSTDCELSLSLKKDKRKEIENKINNANIEW